MSDDKLTLNDDTPWGPAQEIEEILPGIFEFETATKRGFYLSEERRAEMPDFMKRATWGASWWEEGCCWGMVVCFFDEKYPRALHRDQCWTASPSSDDRLH